MSSASTRTFALFQPQSAMRNAAGIFALTTLFYFIGAQLRLVESLSMFWPLNGVMAGVFARYAYLNRLHYYAISYIAMLLYDLITTNWGITSLGINLSNMMFIVTVALLVQRDRRLKNSTPDPSMPCDCLTIACWPRYCAPWSGRCRQSGWTIAPSGRWSPTGLVSSFQPGC